MKLGVISLHLPEPEPEPTSRISTIIFPGKQDTTSDFHFFGYHIMAIPDFLSDHAQLGDSPEAQLKDHCRRWANFVGSLWLDSTQETIVYNLRFCYQPKTKSIAGYLFVSSSQKDVLQRRQELNGIASHIESSLSALGFVRGIHFKYIAKHTDYIGETTHFLAAVRQEEPQYIYQVTQGIDKSELAFGTQAQEYMSKIVPFKKNTNTESESKNTHQTSDASNLSAEQLVIEPWWGPGGSFSLPFSLICNQSKEVTLSIIIQPTQLSSNEVKYFKEKIAFLTSGANFNFSENYNNNNSHQMTDPYVSWLSNLFSVNLQRMKHPFLGLVHVISRDKFTAKTVANSLASQVSQEMPFDPPKNDFQFRNVAQAWELDHDQSEAAMQFYANDLSTYALANILQVEKNNMRSTAVVPQDYKQQYRLPFMFDAKGISTVFRVPVSINGGIQGLAVKQTPPHFEPGPQQKYDTFGSPLNSANVVNLGWFPSGEMAVIPLDELKKHVLITGFTGSGKTKTVLHLLDQLRKPKIPWLVLESAKAEYRGLLKMQEYTGVTAEGKHPKLSVFTLGNEAVSPLRLNPFEIIAGIAVEQHISRLAICFEAAFPPVGPLPSILSEALPAIYRDNGWGLSETMIESRPPFVKKFPTMSDFNIKLQWVIKNRGYGGEILQNLHAAITSRVKPFTLDIPGSRSLMLDCERCTPSLQTLFTHNTILELNDLNSEDKAIIVMFLLVFLREFCETRHRQAADAYEKKQGEDNKDVSLLHMTVIEEAHNILANVSDNAGSEISGNAKFKAVEAFSNMLTEVRAYGEGIIIADQSPKKLHPDAMRNTNLQIAHVIRDRNDRDAVAAAMLMSEVQQNYIGKLKQGHAALFYTGLENASFVKIPHFQAADDTELDPEGIYSGKGSAYVSNLSNAYVVQQMLPVMGHIRSPEGPFQLGCKGCQHFCELRTAAADKFINDSNLKSAINLVIDKIQIFEYNRVIPIENDIKSIIKTHGITATEYKCKLVNVVRKIYNKIYDLCGLHNESKGLQHHIDQKRCEFLHSWTYIESLGTVKELEAIVDPKEFIMDALITDYERELKDDKRY